MGSTMNENSYETINITVDGGVITFQLNRPDRLNALSLQMIEELHRAALDFLYRKDARVLVIKGSGRAFSAGYDINTTRDDVEFRDQWISATKMSEAFRAIETAPVVRVAQLQGHVVGAGLLLAALCDLRYATKDARFFVPELDMGIPFSYGGVGRLARLIGLTRTADLVLNCTPFMADDPRMSGLVTELVDEKTLEDRVTEVAKSIAARPPILTIETITALQEAARDMIPADTIDFPHMFLAQADNHASAVLGEYTKRFETGK